MEKNWRLLATLSVVVVSVTYLLSRMQPEMDLAALFLFGLGVAGLVSARTRNQSA